MERGIFLMPFFSLLVRRNNSHSNYNISYTMKSKKYRGKIVAQNLPSPIPFPSEFTLLLSLIFLGCDISRTLAILQLWILCARKNPSLAAFPHLPPPQSLSSVSLCCECQGCQCHSLTWLEFLTLHQEADRERESRRVGGGAGIRMCSHLKTSRGGGGKPNLLLWGSLITRQLINHPGPFSFIQLVRFLLLWRSLRCGSSLWDQSQWLQ